MVNGCPLRDRSPHHAATLAGTSLWMGTSPTKHKGASIRWIPQDFIDRVGSGQFPEQLSRVDAPRLATGHQQLVVPEAAQHLRTTAQLREAREDEFKGVPNLLVRIFDDPTIFQAEQARWEELPVGPLGDLALPCTVHPHAQEMEFGFTEHAAQPEQQAVIVTAGIEDAIRIGQQRSDEGGQVEQRVPICIVAREAACLVRQNNPNLPERDGGNEGLKAQALLVTAGVAEVVVDDVNLMGQPAERTRTLNEGLLVLSTRPVLTHLFGCGLPNINVRMAVTVLSRDGFR